MKILAKIFMFFDSWVEILKFRILFLHIPCHFSIDEGRNPVGDFIEMNKALIILVL
jgi:hypothetical protein